MIPRCFGESGRKDRVLPAETGRASGEKVRKWWWAQLGVCTQSISGKLCVSVSVRREASAGLAIWGWATCPESSEERHVTGNPGLQDQGVMDIGTREELPLKKGGCFPQKMDEETRLSGCVQESAKYPTKEKYGLRKDGSVDSRTF